MKFFDFYPNFNKCSIQTFDDNRKRGLKELVSVMPVAGNWKEKAKILNEKGAGVFFTVNQMNYGKRGKENVVGVNAWVAESDNISKEQQIILIEQAPLKPSLVIESKKSFHIYYFAKNGTLQNRTLICNGLKDYFDGDSKVANDISRVLRVPGFYHTKEEQDKFLVREKMWNNNMLKTYTEQEMIENFKTTTTKKETRTIEKTPNKNVYDFIWQIDCETMINKLSGTSLVNGEVFELKNNTNGTKQILVNRESTGNWIDLKGFIGNGEKAMNWVGWVEWYGKTTKEIFKWFFENCDDMIPPYLKKDNKPVIKTEEPKQIKKQTINEAINKFSFYCERLNNFGMLGEVGPYPEIDRETSGIIPGKVYTIGAFSNVGKSKFSYNFVNHFLEKGKKVLFFSLEVDTGMLIGNIACNRYRQDFHYFRKNNQINPADFQGLELFDCYYFLEDIEAVSKSIKPDYIFIDFIQNIQTKTNKSSYEETSYVAKRIQRLAIETNATIFSLSQISNTSGKEIRNGNFDEVNLKGAGELIASSDIVFLLRNHEQENNMIELFIKKNKYGKRGTSFLFNADLSSGCFFYHSKI